MAAEPRGGEPGGTARDQPVRVGLVYPRNTLDSVPSLCNTVDLLAEHGYLVDVYTYVGGGAEPAAFTSESVRLRPLGTLPEPAARTPFGRTAELPQPWRLATTPLRRLAARREAARTAEVMAAAYSVAVRQVVAAHREAPYACLIGVDPDGLVLAADLAARHSIPVGYYSLELLLSYEIARPEERVLKEREQAITQRLRLIVIQDEERARLLREDNALRPEQFALVPNAPLGPARRRPTRYWHERFGLRPEQRAVLHAGSLGDWTGIEDIIASVPSWPTDLVLVVHTRYDAGSSQYVDRLRARSDPRRVFFSLAPVPRQAYDDLVDGADVGIAFYVAVGDSSFTRQNIQTIGLSSGKVAAYLRSGLPVVVNDSTIGEIVEREGCGVRVASAADLGTALAEILDNEDRYSARARAFFDETLDFRRGFAAVLERLEMLRRRAREVRA